MLLGSEKFHLFTVAQLINDAIMEKRLPLQTIRALIGKVINQGCLLMIVYWH